MIARETPGYKLLNSACRKSAGATIENTVILFAHVEPLTEAESPSITQVAAKRDF